MSRDVFTHTCRVLFGDQFQTAAATALGLSLSSVVRYANGERAVPRLVFERLSEVLDERLVTLATASKAIKAARPGVRQAGVGTRPAGRNGHA